MRAAALSGPRSVMVASRSLRANSTDTVSYSTALSERVRLSGVSAMPFAPGGRLDFAANSWARFDHRVLELGAGHHLIDQPPVDRALALDAFLGGAEHIGMVAPHLALVGDAGEPAGAGQHREQRQFRQRHRRGAVVDQHDVVGGERQLIAAAGRGAVDDADGRRPEFSLASSMPLRVSLVNLQKLTLCAWLAPASMRILAPAQNTRGLPERSRITRTSGCSKRSRSIASASSISTPRS